MAEESKTEKDLATAIYALQLIQELLNIPERTDIENKAYLIATHTLLALTGE